MTPPELEQVIKPTAGSQRTGNIRIIVALSESITAARLTGFFGPLETTRIPFHFDTLAHLVVRLTNFRSDGTIRMKSTMFVR